MNRYAAVILAAGLSSRMQEFKPLLPLGRETIIERLVATFLECDCRVFAVVGHRAADIRALLAGKSVTVVENHDFGKGMFSSVQAGVRALSSDCTGFFVMPVDIPMVQTSTVRLLQAAADSHPGTIIYPVCHGKRGHPPFVPMELAATIVKESNSGNLKSMLAHYADRSLEVDVADQYILLDIDTPDDYERLLKSLPRV